MFNLYGRWLLIVVVSLALSAPLWAADTPQKLQEVVVSATRTEKAAEEAPASVSVISREEIQQLNVKTVDEVLRYETGVLVKRTKGIADATPRVQLRGLYGQDRTLLLLDGLPVNDGYSAGAPLTQLGIDNIERIEIIRGPGSALYGGHAMGGVINIITRRPTGLEAALKLGGGSDDTRNISASLGQMFWNKFGIRLGYEQEETDGYATTPVSRSLSTATGTETLSGGYETTNTSGDPKWVVGDKGDNWAKRRNLNLQTSLNLPDGGLLSLDGQWGRQKYGYDAPHTYLVDGAGLPTFSGSGATSDGRRFTASPSNYIYYSGMGEETFTHLSLNLDEEIGKLGLNGKLGFQNTDKWFTSNKASGIQDYNTAPGSLSDATTQSLQAELQGNYPLGEDHSLTGGVTFRQNDFDQDVFALSFYRDETSKTAKTEITEGADRFYGVYLQDEWRLPAKLTLYLGARYDYWQAYDGRAGAVGSEQDFSEPDDNAISPKAALVWNPLADTYLRTSVGKAFRPPTIYELYRTWQSGTITYHSNPDLAPETLWNYEAGIDQYFWERRVKLAATVFHSVLDDAIESVTVGSDRYTENVSKAEIDGLELEAEVRPTEWLRLWGNAAWSDSEVVDNPNDPASEGEHLTNVPLTVYNAGLDATWRWLTASLDGNYQGRIYTKTDNSDVNDVYGGYSERWLWNSKLTVTPVERLSVSLAVDNLFDEDYYDYYIGRGRSYLLEVAAKW